MSIALLPLLMRWIHILAAIVAVGGSIFARFVLMPSMQRALDDTARATLRDTVLRHWMKFVHTCILLFLVSGLYNYLVLMVPVHQGQPLYHALLGIKILLALVVFTIAIALTSLKPWSAKIRTNARFWLGLLVALAIVIVCISGVLRAIPHAEAPATTATASLH